MKKTLFFSLALTACTLSTLLVTPARANNNTSATSDAATVPSVAAEVPAAAAAPAIDVTGCVLDSLTHEGEPMATLRVWKQGDTMDNSKAVAMGTTDTDGRFNLQIKRKGDYLLMITSIGRTPIVKPFTVGADKRIDLGTLLIAESAQSLDDVVVAIQKPLIKMDGETIAYSVSDDPDAKTNTLIEMLRKVPMVTVDGEDNIQVNGSSNFQIYMNGSPSPMLSGNPKEVLKVIPAQMIKRIEVLANPGAKYDAEGVGGILNFITDVQQGMEGYTGTVGVRTGDRMNGGSAYVMMQKDKLTLSVNASAMHMNTPTMEMSQSRDNLQDGSSMLTTSTTDGGSNMIFGTVDASYAIDQHNTLSASVSVMSMNSDNDVESLTKAPGSEYTQVNDNKMKSTSVNASLDYQHTYSDDPRHSLIAAYRFSTQPRETDANTTYSLADMPDYARVDKNNMMEHTLQFDYTQPLGEKSTFEAGGKYVWRESTSLSDLLDYENRNAIGALYGTYSHSFGQLTVKGGLRYEFTSQDVKYNKGNGDDFSLTYNNLVPNLTLSLAPSMTQNLSLSYNMRISRPGISVLNPYKNTQNLYFVSYGNPNLDVETSHNTQLTYSYFTPKVMVNASLRYAYQDNGIEQYSFLQDDVLYSTYANIGQRQNTTLSLFSTLSLTPSTRLTLNSNTSYVDLRASQMGYSNSGWQQMLMANLQQTLPWDIKLSAMYMFNSPSISLQGTSASMNMHMLGLSKTLLNDRLSLSLNTVNPFHSTMTMKTTTEGDGYTSTMTSKVSMSSIIASATYRFGDLKMKQQQTHRTQMESDLIEATDSNTEMNNVFMQ